MQTLGQRLDAHPKSQKHPFWVAPGGVMLKGKRVEDDTVGLMLRLICEATTTGMVMVQTTSTGHAATAGGMTGHGPTRVEAMGELLLLLWGEA